MLERVGAAPNVRLACQTRPQTDVVVTPLLPPQASPRDGFQKAASMQGQEQDIAILFADIRGFTTLSENKLPYDVVFILNRYFRAMGEAIEAAGGRVDKFIGDGVMALFGIDGSPERGAAQAIQAARNMAQRLDELNLALADDLPAPLRIGIGIHAGPAIVGEMGYGEATSVTAVGDTVNTASRLESLTKEFSAQLVLSQRVADLAGVDLSAWPATEHAIRGRDEPLPIRIAAAAQDLPGITVPAQRRQAGTGGGGSRRLGAGARLQGNAADGIGVVAGDNSRQQVHQRHRVHGIACLPQLIECPPTHGADDGPLIGRPTVPCHVGAVEEGDDEGFLEQGWRTLHVQNLFAAPDGPSKGNVAPGFLVSLTACRAANILAGFELTAQRRPINARALHGCNRVHNRRVIDLHQEDAAVRIQEQQASRDPFIHWRNQSPLGVRNHPAASDRHRQPGATGRAVPRPGTAGADAATSSARSRTCRRPGRDRRTRPRGRGRAGGR